MKWNRFVNLLIGLYFLLTGMLCLLVLGYSLLTRVVWRQAVENDLFDILPENIPLLAVSVAIAVALLYGIYRRFLLADRGALAGAPVQGRRHRSIYVALATAFLISLFCVLSIRGMAVNDGGFLDECINQFMEGNYSSLEGGYLSTYPFQIGYVMFGQILYLLFGPGPFLVYQILNIGSILVTVWCLYRMTYELFAREELADLTAVLSLGALMLYAYATLVYNDIWSLAPQMLAVYLTMRYIRTANRRMMCGGVLSIALACVLKTNCYIALVAMVLSILLSGLRERNARSFLGKALWAFAAVMMTVGAIKAVNAGYAAAAGLDKMPGGVPSTAYFAMGMHQIEDAGCVKYGWYDGSNVGFLSAAGEDSALAAELAAEDIQERIAEFRATPKYLVKFYLNKFLQQWGDGTCSSMRQMEMTGRNVTPRSVAAESLMYGNLRNLMSWGMNTYHTIIYLGAVLYFAQVFCRIRRRHCGAGDDGGLVITTNEAFLVMFILGGMLFHELWEASSRYVIRYYLSMLPLAAYGYAGVFDDLGKSRLR